VYVGVGGSGSSAISSMMYVGELICVSLPTELRPTELRPLLPKRAKGPPRGVRLPPMGVPAPERGVPAAAVSGVPTAERGVPAAGRAANLPKGVAGA